MKPWTEPAIREMGETLTPETFAQLPIFPKAARRAARPVTRTTGLAILIPASPRPCADPERLPIHQTEALVSFQGSSEVANYTAGHKIRCPVCRSQVGAVSPNTVCSVRAIKSYSEAKPGTSVHECTHRIGKPARKCRALFELRTVDMRQAARPSMSSPVAAVA